MKPSFEQVFFFDIRKEKTNFDKVARLAVRGYGVWFACGGVIAAGATEPGIMDDLIGPTKRHLLEIFYSKTKKDFQKEILSLTTRKFTNKPPIMLVSFKYLSRVVDFKWLRDKYNLKKTAKAKEVIQRLYNEMLCHLVLPLKKEYYDLFPFNRENINKNKVPSAGFMCLGGYPPLLEFVKRYEKIAPKRFSGLPWPFMGTSLAHREQDPVVTCIQAKKHFLEMRTEFKKSIVILEDSRMDFIVEREWKKGGSQSLLDFVDGEENRVLARRRGTAIPEIAREILKKYKIKLVYLKNFEDLYIQDIPPISELGQMREFIERLRI